MDKQTKIDKLNEQLTIFFNTINQIDATDSQADKLDTLLRESTDLSFVSPLAIGMSNFCKRQFPKEFSLEFYILFLLMSLKLDNGDICIRLKKDSLLELVKEKILLGDSNLETLWEAQFESLLEECLTFLLNKDVKKSQLINCQACNDSPLVAFDFDNKAEARVYLRRFYQYEENVSAFIKERVSSAAEIDNDTIEKYKAQIAMLFKDEINSDGQKKAVALATLSPFTVICGGPGTGKTTTVLKLLLLLLANSGMSDPRILLAAPTGKAAGRMIESIQSGKGNESLKAKALPLFKSEDLYNQKIKLIPDTASTVHSLIGIYPHQEVPKYNPDHHLPCDILVVDEISMISLSLFSKLLDAIGPNTKVIMLGDKDQLSSVEPGSVLSDICCDLNTPIKDNLSKILESMTGFSKEQFLEQFGQSYTVGKYVSLLTFTHRFSDDSKLGNLAKLVNQAHAGQDLNREIFESDLLYENKEVLTNHNLINPRVGSDEIIFNPVEQGDKKAISKLSDLIAKTMVDYYNPRDKAKTGFIKLLVDKKFVISNEDFASKANNPFKLLDEFRILCSNKDGDLGVNALNEAVSKKLKAIYKQKFDKNSTEYKLLADDVFFPGQVVLVTKNDRNLNLDNGEIGFVAYSSVEDKENSKARIFFPPKDGNKVREISPERLSNYTQGFAMTIHKSQGSEYQNICMVLSDKLNPVLTKELVYTGLTRAKPRDTNDKVIIVSNKEVFLQAIVKKVERESGLALMLAK